MRIGMICYGPIPTGLGMEARRAWKCCPEAINLTWYAYKHTRCGMGCDYKWSKPNGSTMVECSGGAPVHLASSSHDWLGSTDVVLFWERPFAEAAVWRAKALGKRVVCVVMPEWLPANTAWLNMVTQFIVFTQQGYDHCVSIGIGPRTVKLNQPLDLDELPFRRRTEVKQVVYCDGWGGVHERKGWPEVKAANEMGAGIRVKSQRSLVWPGGKSEPAAANPADLYADADLIVVPGRFDGVGLTLLEAMASGCIVLATEAPPYNEFIDAAVCYQKHMHLIPVDRSELVRIWSHTWPSQRANPPDIYDLVDFWRHHVSPAAIRETSIALRGYIENHHGPSAWKEFWHAVTG